MYRLRLTNRAQKDLDALTGRAWQRVRDAISALRHEPRPRGCSRVRGGAGTYRIRVGIYRVIYDLADAERHVSILRVKHRRDAYRDL